LNKKTFEIFTTIFVVVIRVRYEVRYEVCVTRLIIKHA